MKHLKSLFVLVLLLCITLGCNHDDVSLEPKEDISTISNAGGGGGYTVASQMVSLSTLQTSHASILNVMRNSPSSLLITEGGIQYWQLPNPSAAPLFEYARRIKILKSNHIPPDGIPATWDQLRAQIVTDLDKLSVGTGFKSNLLSSFDYIKTLNGKTFAQFEAYFDGKLNTISNPPMGMTKLTVNERFALTQAYYTLLNQVRWVYQNPSTSNGSGPCNLTREEWIEVAESAFTGGMLSGLGTGFWWAVEGGIATGGHPVGVAIGGLAGFVTGFIGGATAGGGVKLMWECLENKLFAMKIKYMCGSGRVIYAHPNQPVPSGCFSINPPANIPDLKQYAFVPLKGNTALPTQTVNDINWLLSYF